jgi:hypothetical protein
VNLGTSCANLDPGISSRCFPPDLSPSSRTFVELTLVTHTVHPNKFSTNCHVPCKVLYIFALYPYTEIDSSSKFNKNCQEQYKRIQKKLTYLDARHRSGPPSSLGAQHGQLAPSVARSGRGHHSLTGRRETLALSSGAAVSTRGRPPRDSWRGGRC